MPIHTQTRARAGTHQARCQHAHADTGHAHEHAQAHKAHVRADATVQQYLVRSQALLAEVTELSGTRLGTGGSDEDGPDDLAWP